jgi:hypothetical protein
LVGTDEAPMARGFDVAQDARTVVTLAGMIDLHTEYPLSVLKLSDAMRKQMELWRQFYEGSK